MTTPLRFGVFRNDEPDPFALFADWHDARAFADACALDDPHGLYIVGQKVTIGLTADNVHWSRWQHCPTKEDIQ